MYLSQCRSIEATFIHSISFLEYRDNKLATISLEITKLSVNLIYLMLKWVILNFY
jgi:hypothetical protein